MLQQNHEAHEGDVTLSAEDAIKVLDLLDAREGDLTDGQDSIMTALEGIAAGDEGASFTAEQASFAAKLVRGGASNGYAGGNDDVLKALDSVAAQHGLKDAAKVDHLDANRDLGKSDSAEA